MASHVWSKQGLEQIKRMKQTILRRKILLGFVETNFTWWDKWFKRGHIVLASITPMITLIDQQLNGSIEATSNVTLVLGSIVAGLIKVKDYLKFDKVKDIAKQQNIRYESLLQRIGSEESKPDGKKQTEEEFIYWINREFNSIELNDPDISFSMRDKFIAWCEKNKIQYDSDMDLLLQLENQIDVKVEKVECEQKNIEMQPRIDQAPLSPRTKREDRRNNKQKIQSFDAQADINYAKERLNALNDD